MKKHIIAVFLVIVMCLATVSGCSLMKSFERDVQVTLVVNGETRGEYTVNIFNNAVVEEPSSADAPQGTKFYGWTAQENWAELEREQIVIAGNVGLIRYDDVKDYVNSDGKVTLYAAFLAPIPHDLVVAWYRAEGVSTQTGLTEEIMQTFTGEMYTFLESKDYTPAAMDIVIRPYDGNVGTSCGNILSDGDVNIMVGWGGNIGTTGGMSGTVIENPDNVSIGTIPRNAARLDNNYLTRLVFVWILNTYGGQQLEYPIPGEVVPEPEPEPEPTPTPSDLPAYTVGDEQFTINIAWYAKEDTSGINQANMDALKTLLETDLQTMGFTLANVTITITGYAGNVAESCAAVKAAGNVDIMLGWGANIGSKNDKGGKLTQGEDFLKNVDGVKVGTETRYVANCNDNFFTSVVFAWIQNTYGTAVDYPAGYGWEPAAPAPDPTDEVKLVIGWYSLTDTSGLDAAIMATFEAALKAYLTSQGYNLDEITLEIRDLGTGNVASVQTAVDKAKDVDMVLGMKKFEPTTHVYAVQNDVKMGDKTDRRIHLLSQTEIAKSVFEWLETPEARATLTTE